MTATRKTEKKNRDTKEFAKKPAGFFPVGIFCNLELASGESVSHFPVFLAKVC